MAAFVASSSNLVIVESWRDITLPNGKFTKRLLTITLSSQGGATNYIAASELGFVEIFESSHAIADDNSEAVATSPSYDRSKLFFLDDAQEPVDVTDTYRLVVSGIST